MITKSIIEKLKKIKLVAMDIDGTLTDGSLYYGKNGEELKRFNVRDGMAVTLMHKNGIKSAIITSENSPIVTARANKLNITDVYLGSRNKTDDIKEIADKNNLSLDEIAFIGDDINDLPALKTVGFSAAPADSSHLILNAVDYICKKNGGHGALREIVELIFYYQKINNFLQENW